MRTTKKSDGGDRSEVEGHTFYRQESMVGSERFPKTKDPP